MSRALKTDIPGADARVRLDELRERELPDPLVVEIGFGRGEFLIELARAEPEQAFLGVEVSYKRTLKMARRLARLEIGNVMLLEGPAEVLLREVLPAGSVAGFWVNFPDPWPKKRHHRRRLFQPATVADLTRCLRPAGWLRIATDHAGYAEWIDEQLSIAPGLVNAYAPEPWRPRVEGRTPTAYELEWRAQGRSFHFFEYVRSCGGPPL